MPLWVTLLVGLAGALVGTTGAVAWVKVFAERKKVRVDAELGTATISSTLLKDVYQSYRNLADDLAQTKMECAAIEQENEDLHKIVQELRLTVSSQQFDLSKSQRNLNEESEKTWLARRQAHLADNTLGNYELHIESLLDELRKCKVPITPMMRPQRIRAAYQAEKEKLEKLESRLTDQIVKPEEKSDE